MLFTHCGVSALHRPPWFSTSAGAVVKASITISAAKEQGARQGLLFPAERVRGEMIVEKIKG